MGCLAKWARWAKNISIIFAPKFARTIDICTATRQIGIIFTTKFSNGFGPFDFTPQISTRNIKKFTRRQHIQTATRFIVFSVWVCLFDNMHGIKFIATRDIDFAISVIIYFDCIWHIIASAQWGYWHIKSFFLLFVIITNHRPHATKNRPESGPAKLKILWVIRAVGLFARFLALKKTQTYLVD